MSLIKNIINLPKIFTGSNSSNASNALTFLILLLATDFFFFFFHCLQLTPLLDSPLLALGVDQGYPEMFQYIKALWVITLLLFVFYKTRIVDYILWALLFFYILLDDLLKIHERLGKLVVENIELTSFYGLQTIHFGELVVTALIAIFLLTPLFLFYVKSEENSFKQASRYLFLLFLALVFFGVVIDMVHIMLSGFGEVVDHLMEGIEEGGEMIVMSFTVWYVYLLDHRHGEIIDLLLKTKK